VKTLELKHASRPLADYAAQIGSEGIVLTSKKKPIAALVSVRGAEAEGLALSMNPAFLKIIRRARAEVKGGKVVTLRQVKRDLLGASPGKSRRPAPRKAARR
jgi:hypothetical protein